MRPGRRAAGRGGAGGGLLPGQVARISSERRRPQHLSPVRAGGEPGGEGGMAC